LRSTPQIISFFSLQKEDEYNAIADLR